MKPYVWQMIKEAVQQLRGEVSTTQIIQYIQSKYGDVNESTIRAHICSCAVNHASRVHYPRNSRPRVANRECDFLYRTHQGRVELYDPARHGRWEIQTLPDGRLAVAGPDGKRFAPYRAESSAAGEARDVTASFPTPTKEALSDAHAIFLANETRQADYDQAAREVEVALHKRSPKELASALLVLLRSWNKQYYHFRPFRAQDRVDLEALLDREWLHFLPFRARSIDSLCEQDRPAVISLYASFEGVLGPVGAAKSLHLLAPGLFPIWDRAVAAAYGLPLLRVGKNAAKYHRFMLIAKEQVAAVGGEHTLGLNLLKAIDEWNYCLYTKRWSDRRQTPKAHASNASAEAQRSISIERVTASTTEFHMGLQSLHPRIAERCRVAFQTCQYDDAILRAMKVVEIELRNASGAAPTDVGMRLIDIAMEGDRPRIVFSDTYQHQRAVRDLFRGAFGRFRNVLSHQFEDVADPAQAFECLVIASLLMRELDRARLASHTA